MVERSLLEEVRNENKRNNSLIQEQKRKSTEFLPIGLHAKAAIRSRRKREGERKMFNRVGYELDRNVKVA